MVKIIAVAIQKGGTGKTTTAAAITQAAVYKGRKVLAIDLDPQANLTFTLNADATGKGSYEFLQGAADTVQHLTPLLDVIPASISLALQENGSTRKLQKALEPIKDNYDLIVIDTPPTAGELQYNALQAATGLIIPLQADTYNLQSLYQMCNTAQAAQVNNPGLKIMGFIFTQHDNRSRIVQQMKETITVKATAMGVPYLGTIRAAAVVKEAAALQQSLFEYAPNSKPAIDYLTLFDAMNL